MSSLFFEKPILNSPCESRHWELDASGPPNFLDSSYPYKPLKTNLKAEISAEAWESPNSDMSPPFGKPTSGRIDVKVITHLGDEGQRYSVLFEEQMPWH